MEKRTFRKQSNFSRIFVFFCEMGYKSENIWIINDGMFSEKIQMPSCGAEYWVRHNELYLTILDKYIGENFFSWNDGYHLHKGSYLDGVLESYGLSGIDVDDLVGQIIWWFWEALKKYNFEEVTRELDVSREAFVYAELRTCLRQHCRYLKVRHRIIPPNKFHKTVRYLKGYTEDTRCQIDPFEFDLEPIERLVIESFYYENLTVKQISEIIDRSESTVKRLKKQALNKLRLSMN